MPDALQPHGLTAAGQASVSFRVSWSLFRRMPLESAALSNPLILCRTFLCLPSVFPSIRVFSRVGSSRQVAKVLELQLRQQLPVRRFKEGAGGCWKGVSEVSPRGHGLCLPDVTGSGLWWCFPARVPPDPHPHPAPLSTALFREAHRTDGSPVSFVSVWLPPHSPAWGATGTRGL